MKSFLIKALPIAITLLAIFAIFQIVYTIMIYDNILTALPLWMSVVINVVLWLIPILIGTIIYFKILKQSK